MKSKIQFGCQFYTWQMSGKKYVGALPHLSKLVARAGYAGIEPETYMLGDYYENPVALKDVLDEHNLLLGAIALVEKWEGHNETDQEREEAEKVFSLLDIFPHTHLVLCQLPGKDRLNLKRRQDNAIACVNAIAGRAFDRGISCSFHPNSPPGSVFRNQEDYRYLLNQLDETVVGFTPDTGHIAKGGMNVCDLFETYRELIRHVHFKDMDASGDWAAMGKGMIDFLCIVKMLRDSGYAGWIMVEEESVAAEVDPDTTAVTNGEYISQTLLPML